MNKNRISIKDLVLRKYQMGGYGIADYEEPIDPNAEPSQADNVRASLGQAAGAIPVWGQLAQANMAIGDAIGGDQTKTGRVLAANAIDPAKGIFNAFEGGDWKEAIPLVGGIWTAKRRRAEEAKLKRQKNVREDKALFASSLNKLDGYDSFGNQNAALGGKLKRLSSDTVEVEGRTHAEGGVKLNPSTEVEDNETINGDYVFSDALGFADRHKKIAKQLGKIEKKPLTRGTRVAIEILRKKEEALKQEQEAIRAQLGLGEEAQMLGAMFGGNVKRLQMGGLTDPDYTPPASTEEEYKKYMEGTYNNRQIGVQKDWKYKGFTPQEEAALYDIKEYNRDNYNKWKKAYDSGQDVTMDSFGISQEEASEFGRNPYLKSFKQYYGKPNDMGVPTQDMVVAPTFYERNPYIPPVDQPIQQQPAKALTPIATAVIKKQTTPVPTRNLKGAKLKVSRPENARIGYNKKGNRGFRLVN